MGPKQKGGGLKQKSNAVEEVEETFQGVVCQTLRVRDRSWRCFVLTHSNYIGPR